MIRLSAAIAVALLVQYAPPAGDTPEATGVDKMVQEAAAVRPLVQSSLAMEFLDAIACLPRVDTRTVFYNKQTRDALTVAQAQALAQAQLAGFEATEIPEEFFYYTRYGTPVAFVRPLEILGRAGVKSSEGLKVVDFGFGTIGQLRALAAVGAHASGIEVDALLRAIYSQPGDTGVIERCKVAGEGSDGSLELVFGQFPADLAITRQVGDGYDVFISKNTLKRGYIHPERDVDPGKLVQLRVDDETFVRAMYDLLKPGGFALIYNLAPAPSRPEEPYKHWADGRSPWPRELYERVGFAVVAYDTDDNAQARAMGKALGWDAQMNLETDLFGLYTLLRKPQ
ncbi:MAG: hypothetical protein OEX18_05540 [Candidatus Krumholzibacteria bacterium]|nr:hypothetical protein [Candidatus Krumholzibacteria bacterium]MDH4336724.1 hypothetical protein [Candidatus Krumholzibacteria bacterium]MDH5271219.1 hypothetical protein [Candidatus Krumholzibacteria bacterium]